MNQNSSEVSNFLRIVVLVPGIWLFINLIPVKPAFDKEIDNSCLFEVSWEVCNKVGGIHTVLRTKIPAMKQRWGDNYFLVGPYHEKAAELEFEESEPHHSLKAVIEQLKGYGINCYFGHWLVKGRPNVILLDYRSRFAHFAQDKYFLWKEGGISCDNHDPEVDEMVAFGSAVYEFFRALSSGSQKQKLVAQFHEWQAATAIPRIRYNNLQISTVFTTHATLLGRYVAADNPYFYDQLPSIDPDATARHYNIHARHLIERVAAQKAHIFTTISDITAREAEHFLGRKADYITSNGINNARISTPHEYQSLHQKYKERIDEFVMGHFFPSYSFDINNTIYLFISGRYEYRNKGMDVYIESLQRLNERLKREANPPTVVAFVITNAALRSVNLSAIQNQMMFDELKNICDDISDGISERMMKMVSRGNLPGYEDLLPLESQLRIKRAVNAFKSESLPGIVTHDLADDGNDAVLQHLRHRGLFNQPDDPVKVVFHPEFVTATSPLLGIDYDQFVRGCHLGVFPSYYEPWGYTPLECLALGIPTVTSDLSGFGSYVQRHIPDHDQRGIYVLERSGMAPDRSIELLADRLHNFVSLSLMERTELRAKAQQQTELFAWSKLVVDYHAAHDDALGHLSNLRPAIEVSKGLVSKKVVQPRVKNGILSNEGADNYASQEYAAQMQ